jgi:superfamily II RNA helicase
MDNSVRLVLDLLEKWNVINQINQNTNDKKYNLTLNGHIAKQLREVHCIIFAELVTNNTFKQLTTVELIGVLSCFTNVSVTDDQKSQFPVSTNTGVKQTITKIYEMYNVYKDIEVKNNIDTGIDYYMHFDLTDYIIKWCECETEVECKLLLQTIFAEKGIFLGEFIKAILKINNISAELEKIAETICDMEFLDKLKRIPELTMKFVATNQSLYV